MKKAYGLLDWTGVRLPAAPPSPSVALAKEGFLFATLKQEDLQVNKVNDVPSAAPPSPSVALAKEGFIFIIYSDR